MSNFDSNEKVFTDTLALIKAIDIEVDFDGIYSLVCLSVRVDEFAVLHAFISTDGSRHTYWGREEFIVTDDTVIWDIRLSEDGIDGTPTKMQYLDLLTRVQKVIDQGLDCAYEELAGDIDYTGDYGYEAAKAADETLKANAATILATANA